MLRTRSVSSIPTIALTITLCARLLAWGAPATPDPFTTALPSRDTTAPERRGDGGGDASVDEQTGAAGYGVPIEVPAGRGGMAPSLALSYSSQSPLRGGIAVGWSMGLPSIERDPEVRDAVAYRAGGQRLVPAPDDPEPGQNFRAERDTSFARYQYLPHDETWVVRTLDGTRQIFEAGGHVTPSHLFTRTRWHLTREIDAFGNRVDYAWTSSLAGPDPTHQYGEWVLSSIEYTANDLAGLTPHAKVELAYAPMATCGGLPIGAAIDHHFGVRRMTGSRRLDEIQISVRDEQDGPWRLSRRYELQYDDDKYPCTGAALRYLAGVEVTAYDRAGVPTVAPPLAFGYGPKERMLTQGLYLQEFGGGERGTTRGPTSTLLDFDGDGWLDRLTIGTPMVGAADPCRLEVKRGTGVGTFAAAATVIDLPSARWHNGTEPTPHGIEGCTLAGQTVYRAMDVNNAGCWTNAATVSYDFRDWDGDGLVDIVSSLHETEAGSAGGDFTPPAWLTEPEMDTDTCSASCPAGMEQRACENGQLTCGCPGGQQYVNGQCDDTPDCLGDSVWDESTQSCVPTGDGCFGSVEGCPDQPMPGDPNSDNPSACSPPTPTQEPAFGGHYRLYVQHNRGRTPAGGVDIEPFYDAMQVSSPVPTPPNASPGNIGVFSRPGVPSLFDLDGDGFLDVLSMKQVPDLEDQPLPGSDEGRTLYMWPGTGGSEFGAVEAWSLPKFNLQMLAPSWDGSAGVTTTPGTIEVRDLDADGLPDIIAVSGNDVVVLRNTGDRSFMDPVSIGLFNKVEESRAETSPSSYPPRKLTTGDRAHTIQFVDVDDDGYPEQLVMPTPVGAQVVQDALWRLAHQLGGGTFHGTEFLPREWEPFEQAVVANEGLWHRYSDAVDVTGDGLADMVTWVTRPVHHRFVTGGEAWVDTDAEDAAPPRLLTSIDNGLGAVTRFEYASSTDPGVVDLGEGHLSARSVVRRIVIDFNGLAQPITTTYRYGNPQHGFDGPLDRGAPSFLGFGYVTVDKSGQLGDDSARTITSFELAPVRPIDTWSFVKQADGTHAQLAHSHQSWHYLPVYGGSAASVVVPEVTSTWTCAAGATSASCAMSPLAVTSTAETWTPYQLTASGPVLHYQHTGTRVVASDVDSAQVTTRRYEVSTLDGTTRQVLAEVTRGDDVDVLERTVSYRDARLMPVETANDRDSSEVVTTKQGFDLVGNPTWTMTPSQVAGDELVSTIEYDEHQLYPRITTNELGHEVVQEHDIATGALLRSSGPNDDELDEYVVDGFGRMLEHRGSTAPDGDVRLLETFIYVDAFPSRTIHTAIQDHDTGAVVISETIYDGLGRVSEEIARRQIAGEPDAVKRYFYDQGGAVYVMELPDPSTGATGTVTYAWERDGVGRTIRSIRPDGSGEDVAYSGNDTVVTERSPQGTTTRFHEDALGALRWVHEVPLSHATEYHYDALGRIDRIIDADGDLTVLAYDMQGHRTAIVRGGRTWTYGYDPDGNLDLELSPVPPGALASEYATVSAYDVLGRVRWTDPARRGLDAAVQKRLGIGTTKYIYDTQRLGSLAVVSLPFGSIELEVDADGQVSRETRKIAVPLTDVATQQFVERDYDALGALRSVRWDDGTEWRYQYDARGMVQEVAWQDPSTGVLEPLAIYERGISGAPNTRTYGGSGGSQRREWKYDRLGRPVSDWIWSPSSGETFGERGYGYDGDEVAEVWGETHGLVADASYQYDARHRLIGAQGPLAYTADLAFGATGNVTHAAIAGALDAPDRDVVYKYAGFDPQAVAALLDPSGTPMVSVDYDLSGNMIERQGPEGARTTLTWDGEDQLRQVVNDHNGVETYLFGPGGERLAAIGPGGVKLWFDESETHFDPGGSRKLRYHHVAAGEPIARILDGNEAELQYADILSNLMLAVDTGGQITASFLYGAFGEVVASSGEKSHSRRFNGKEHDDVSGLRHYGYRSYDPLLLRWISADPMFRFAPDAAWTEPQRANLYAFSLNNPMRWVDPDGLNGNDPVDESGGHHIVAENNVAKKVVISDAAREVFETTTTGWPKGVVRHGNSIAHIQYDDAVIDELHRWLAQDKGIDGELMTAGDAKEFIEHLKNPKAVTDPRIRDFLDPHLAMVKLARDGEKASKINKIWKPIKKSFTKAGGWLTRHAKPVAKVSAKIGKYAGPIGKCVDVAFFGFNWYQHGFKSAAIDLGKDLMFYDFAINMAEGHARNAKRSYEMVNGPVKPGQYWEPLTNPGLGKR